jgi:4a-hydroxytetrahydrobiopterin dehydratase
MLTLQEMQIEMKDLNEWSLSGDSISKNFSFTNFKESLDFVNKVGEIAEKLEHHPDIMLNYNQVRLSLTTHSEQGLTKSDFLVAREIDKLS